MIPKNELMEMEPGTAVWKVGSGFIEKCYVKQDAILSTRKYIQYLSWELEIDIPENRENLFRIEREARMELIERLREVIRAEKKKLEGDAK